MNVGQFNSRLDQIERALEEGVGDKLPEVSSSDNGDVLAVVNGAWAKAEAPGNAPFIVHFTYNGISWSADKNFAEIMSNFDEVGDPKNNVIFEADGQYMPAYPNSGKTMVIGNCFYVNTSSNYMDFYRVMVASNSTVYVNTYSYTLTPDT